MDGVFTPSVVCEKSFRWRRGCEERFLPEFTLSLAEGVKMILLALENRLDCLDGLSPDTLNLELLTLSLQDSNEFWHCQAFSAA